MRIIIRFAAFVTAALFLTTLVGALWGHVLCWVIAAECGIFPAFVSGGFGIVGLAFGIVAAMECAVVLEAGK